MRKFRNPPFRRPASAAHNVLRQHRKSPAAQKILTCCTENLALTHRKHGCGALPVCPVRTWKFNFQWKSTNFQWKSTNFHWKSINFQWKLNFYAQTTEKSILFCYTSIFRNLDINLQEQSFHSTSLSHFYTMNHMNDMKLHPFCAQPWIRKPDGFIVLLA